jgi:hypothetical protein
VGGNLVQLLLRRSYCEKLRQDPSDGKYSNDFWPYELKIKLYIFGEDSKKIE